MKNRSLKQRLVCAVLALVMMVTSLLGTTFAWFTDEVTSAGNKIESGSLKIDLLHKDGEDWISVKDNPEHKIFDYDKWEPGFTNVETLKIANLGSLALQYRLSIEVADGTAATGKNGEDLADVIDVYVVYGDSTASSLNDITAGGVWVHKGTLAEVMKNPASFIGGELLPTGEVLDENAASTTAVGSQIVKIALHMKESAGNEYQKLSVGDIYVNLVATQWGYEDDSFGNDYDSGATFPTFSGDYVASAPVEVNGDNTVKNEVTLSSKENEVSATVPSGTLLEAGVNNVTLTVSSLKNSDSNIEVSENQVLNAVDVHVSGIAAGNTAPILVTVKELLAKGLNMGNYELYHVENGTTIAMTYVATAAELDAHNEFTYDPATGDVVMALCSFSEIALLIADTANPWNGTIDEGFASGTGTEDDPYIIANADQLAYFGAVVGGMNGYERNDFAGQFVKLVSDINLGDAEASNDDDKIFYPIGYYFNENYTFEGGKMGVYSTVYSFEGTFDGNGNIIANFYQNTWEMKGDYNDGYPAGSNYYKDAMGLFGYVVDGTVKNLTVDNFSSDGEFTPTGVIAAYSVNSTFENIAITNCNPRVYNTGNGGIIGIAGNSGDQGTKITLKNITVDNSNKISALWGSWDVACGGLVGMFRGNADGGTGEIEFVNCHVAAQIDVYNDVCANYQYYAYRYAGMIIGSVRHNTTNDEGRVIPNMTGISATGCTVNYGDWNDYYYCEFEKNSMASYSEDYQFSRVPHSELVFDDKNGNGVVDADERDTVSGCTHEHTAEENHKAIYLPFHQLFTGYSWGVSSIGLEKYSGIVTNLDITEGDKEESVVKFESKFTGDFLYRVGNKNTVSLGLLFAAADGVTISDAGVWVKVEKLDEDMNVSGTFTANTTDWTQGKIQFSGTGVVKVTIQDYNFCKPTEVLLEVVDAKNVTTTENATSTSVVLLNDVTNGSFSVGGGYAFYGNGFTITLNPSNHTTNRGAGFDGYIHMTGGILDNVRIEGPVFAAVNIYRVQGETGTGADDPVNYFRNAVIIDSGNNVISNSYISGARAAIYVKGGSEQMIENTTVSGGAYANIEIACSSTVKLNNVATVQTALEDSYDAGKTMIGMGIVVSNEGAVVTIEGELNQYNWVTEAQWDAMIPSAYASQFPDLFNDSTFSAYQKQYDGETYINLAFIFICNWTPTTQIVDRHTNTDLVYTKQNVELGNVSGGVYSVTSPDLNSTLFNAPTYIATTQGPVRPVVTWDHTSKNNEPESSGSNDFCYYDDTTSKYLISFDDGKTKAWYYDILTISKGTVSLPYTVSVTGNAVIDNTNQTITFSEAGDYIVTYMYTDTLNYALTDGKVISTYTTEYERTVKITVYEVVDTSAKTEFAFGDNGFRQETANGVTYVMPNVTSTVDSNTAGIRKTTIGGVDIYYPVVSMHKSGSSSWYNYFSVFEAVTITDLDGTVHSTSSTALPSGLTVIGGFILDVDGNVSSAESANGTSIFNYSTGKEIKCTTYSSYGLCYYPDSQFTKSGTSNRDEQTIVVKYQYTDSNGKTFYYYVGYWCEKHEKSSTCVTGDTLVTLSDGTQKRVDSLDGTEWLLVWDFYKGEYTVSPVGAIVNHGYDTVNEVVLHFADGSTIKTIKAHGFYDVIENNFVIIDEFNVADYIGHDFVKYDNSGNIITTELVDYSVESKTQEIWTLVSAVHFNCILNGLLTLSPTDFPDSPSYLMPFEIGYGMKYDEAKMQADIETYGQYTYEDFAEYCTYEQFVGMNFANWKVAVGKGYIEFEDIIYLIRTYLDN